MQKLKHMTRTTCLALALAALAPAQDTEAEASLDERLAAWQLEATVGVPDAEAITALEALVAEARRLAASQTQTREKLKAEKTVHAAMAELARHGAKPASQQPGAARSLEDEFLEGEVAAALERGDSKFLERLGDHATVPLTNLALRSTGIPAKEGSFSALARLRNSSPVTALTVILQLLESPNKLVREEAFRQAATALGHSYRGVWLPDGALGWRLAQTSWNRIATLATEEDGLDPKTKGTILEAFARRGVLPRSLADPMLQLANEGHVHLNGEIFDPESLWLYRDLFERGNLEIRHDVTRRLQYSPHLAIAYPGAFDDWETTQAILASRLLSRDSGTYADAARTGTNYETYFPEASETLTETFKALVTSKFPEVATAALRNAEERIKGLGTLPFGGETLLDLIASVDEPDLMWRIMKLTRGIPEEERPGTLTAAIQHAAPMTEESQRSRLIIQTLQKLPSFGIAASNHFWPLAGASAPFLDLGIKNRRADFADTVDHAVSERGLDPGGMLDWLEHHGQGHEWPLRRNFLNNGPYCQWIRALAETNRFRLLVELSTSVFGGNSEVSTLIRGGYLADPTLLERAVRDPRSSDAVKTEAAEYLLKDTNAPLAEELLPELASAYASYRRRPGTHFLPYMEASQRAQVFALWLADPNVPDDFLLQARFDFQDEGTMQAVMNRFPRSGWAKIQLREPELLKDAVNFAVEHSSETLHPLLAGDITEASRMYEWIAFTIKGHRSAVLQPVATAILREARTEREWAEAVQAVAGYFNPEAAASLLEAARSTSRSDYRKVAMDALREITEWRETARAWSRAADAELKRANAIAELVAVVKDSARDVEVRAASLRGLGLLAAAEELPLIIEAMTSDEPEIQAAARAALARLEQEADR